MSEMKTLLNYIFCFLIPKNRSGLITVILIPIIIISVYFVGYFFRPIFSGNKNINEEDHAYILCFVLGFFLIFIVFFGLTIMLLLLFCIRYIVHNEIEKYNKHKEEMKKFSQLENGKEEEVIKEEKVLEIPIDKFNS